ncbi:MAG: tRNA (adenosine(37)-N6)-threonylcarbamoyltransferase complex dimerization subunit type 1 TsaB [Verrucomicrobiota bacterium]|nr:tRNA (adenosine(37)-N6)-threonylcarbamoyltransferase complex dimerization subunit type 1 TsaB [Verrucomicrobiota bacterium]
MKILALENSSAQGSVAWLEDDCEPTVFEFPNDRKHSGAFFQSLQRFSDRFDDLNSIVVGLGPGSYAGVRIAISAAIGLRSSSGARLLGLPSICALATEANEYCVVGDARRQSFFFARIGANEIVEGVDLYDEAELRARLAKLDPNIPIFSSETLAQFEQAIVRYPSALVLARLIQRGVSNPSPAPLEPIYLRAPHITIPGTGA